MEIKQEKEEMMEGSNSLPPEEGQDQLSSHTSGLLSPNGTMTSSFSSVSLNDRRMPTGLGGLSHGLHRPLSLSPSLLDTLSESRLLYQVKRFLSTLIKFGADISAQVGEKVKKIVFDLVVDKISISQFQKLIQDVTTFPVRSFMLPFLHTHIPLLREKVVKLAAAAGCSPLSYLAKHESVVLSQETELSSPTQDTELFHSDQTMESQVSARKRKSVSVSENGCTTQKKSNQQSSPPLFPTANSTRSQNIVYPHHWNPSGGKVGIVSGIAYAPSAPTSQEVRSTEEEWKNVQVMLTCILGMVEKTQRAINILQQRQTTSANISSSEDMIEAVKENANAAIMELKKAAMEEIRKAGGDGNDKYGELCLNCGRKASETCSGCNQAKYCGPFCQQRDWDVGGHQVVCRGEELRERNDPEPHSTDGKSCENPEGEDIPTDK